MARIPSNMIPIGTDLPDANLFNTISEGKESIHNIAQNDPILVMFICNHCPFVIHLHQGIKELYELYKNTVLKFVAVSANDVSNYPEDSPENMKLLFGELNLDFPYLYDQDQSFARKLDAACTPDFYLFDSDKKLVYRGRFDESRPGNGIPVTGIDIKNAIDNLLQRNKISEYQKPSLGCNIKWK